jgi:outer membrane protein W
VGGGRVAEVSPSNAITTLSAGQVDESSVSINNSGQYLLTYSEFVANGLGAEITGRLGQLH